MFTPVDILGANGSIAKRLERYELREEQLAMAEAVNRAFIEKRHLLVEAGTGVGKSFAYLIPAILQTAGKKKVKIADAKSSSNNIVTINNSTNNSTANINVTKNHVADNIVTKNELPPKDAADNWNIPFEYDSPETYNEDEFDYLNDDLPESFDRKTTSQHEIPRVVISTHTISLQEQIMEKDIPFLRSVLPFEFTAVLVKGRSNYLCLRRFFSASQRLGTLFDELRQHQFERIRTWVSKTEDGSKSALSPEPDWEIWAEICCETGNCTGKKCNSHKNCFYNKARRHVASAQILIVNHALFFSDLMLRMQSGGILPSYNMLVFDEAHTVEQVASDHIGISVTQYQVEYNLHRIYNKHTQKGLVKSKDFSVESEKISNESVTATFFDNSPKKRVYSNNSNSNSNNNRNRYAVEFGEIREIVSDCLIRTNNFFSDLANWVRMHPGSNGRVRETGLFQNSLSEGLNKLAERLRRVIEKLEDPSERQEFRSVRDKIISIRDDVNCWTNQSLESESVYWIDIKVMSGDRLRISINASPIDVGPILRKHLFEQIPSVVMTSATLTTE
ncbi:MAG: DEAD/DEAH box helicase [Planctomycetaceae bacterium]|jgi:ATP-dependent DNA helicase DinG|nr:DEAD/DEAH box helicase [Planctomycetaceae bacterium]